MPDKEKIPFIAVDMDRATQEDYQRLEELGWTKGTASAHGGEIIFLWEREGEPELPEDLAEKVIGTTEGKIEYARRINTDTERE